jgi:hypothetical protein
MTHHSDYIPALGLRVLTPFYDRVLRSFFRESELKEQLVAAAGFAPGHCVLDQAGTTTRTSHGA